MNRKHNPMVALVALLLLAVHLPKIRCAAALDVVMPDKEEVQPNE